MTDNCDPDLKPSSGDTSRRPEGWFESLKRYVQETDVRSLNLSGMNLNVQEVTTILEFLAHSQVNELDLRPNYLKNKMESISRLLTPTKIQKLNLSALNADAMVCLPTEDVMSLMKILKDTQIKELGIETRLHNFSGHIHAFTSHLVESHLTALRITKGSFRLENEEAQHFIQTLRNTSLTHLTLDRVFKENSRQILTLFSELKHTSITHLDLLYQRFSCSSGERSLGDSLRESKLVELDLTGNYIDDAAMDDLAEALVGSKITSLNLRGNCFRGENKFHLLLRETQITNLNFQGNYRFGQGTSTYKPRNDVDFLAGSSVESLNLCGCLLANAYGVPFMKSLRFSKLKHLDVRRNYLKFSSLAALVEVIKHTSLVKFSYSHVKLLEGKGDVNAGQSLLLIGELSEGSKLEHLELSAFDALQDQPLVITAFVEKLANSHVKSLNMTGFGLGKIGTDVISPILAKTQITHLSLGSNAIRDGVLTLAANLKFTSITHLDLSRNDINDEGAEALAGCLKETRIVDLDLSFNKITCHGAAALAPSLHSNFTLKLSNNQIEDEGLGFLAEHVKSNLVTELDVSGNLGNVFEVETAIWNNRRLVNQLDRS